MSLSYTALPKLCNRWRCRMSRRQHFHKMALSSVVLYKLSARQGCMVDKIICQVTLLQVGLLKLFARCNCCQLECDVFGRITTFFWQELGYQKLPLGRCRRSGCQIFQLGGVLVGRVTKNSRQVVLSSAEMAKSSARQPCLGLRVRLTLKTTTSDTQWKFIEYSKRTLILFPRPTYSTLVVYLAPLGYVA